MSNQTRSRKIRRKRKLYLSLCMAAVMIIAAAVLFLNITNLIPEQLASASPAADKHTNPTIDLTSLYSSNVILIDVNSGDTLAEKSSTERIYPASLTKIMTALLAAEHTADLDQLYPMPPDIYSALYVQNASMAGFLPGEEVPLRDLLYGILLPSGAECCLAFAGQIAGSEAAFVEMMNQKAAELGMSDTHFCNSTGLHEADHYSTVKDLSFLVRYALNNEAFRTAFICRHYTTTSTAEHPEGFTLNSTLFNNLTSSAVNGGEFLGGKTGYTQEAQLCLASLASIGGSEYILVTAHAEGSQQTEPFHVWDAVNVYNQIESTY